MRLRPSTTADLLLDLLETVAPGEVTADQAVRRLSGSHPAAGLARRVRTGLRTLADEGLVTSVRRRGRTRYAATDDGHRALARRGRLPGSGTVLFTDLADSTALIDELGEDEAHACRLRHFALLRTEVERRDGHVVKTLGDGLMAVFADARAATACAQAMQHAVAADRDGLGLRVGLHSGDLVREGGDVFGTTVIVAARLCARARPGEILASDATCAEAQCTARALGPLTLRGLRAPVDASAVAWTAPEHAEAAT